MTTSELLGILKVFYQKPKLISTCDDHGKARGMGLKAFMPVYMSYRSLLLSMIYDAGCLFQAGWYLAFNK